MPIELKIRLNDNGTLSMEGPIDNLFQCYGLMELAKDALRERVKAQQAKVQSPLPADIAVFARKS